MKSVNGFFFNLSKGNYSKLENIYDKSIFEIWITFVNYDLFLFLRFKLFLSFWFPRLFQHQYIYIEKLPFCAKKVIAASEVAAMLMLMFISDKYFSDLAGVHVQWQENKREAI